jgi:hypothetical protein
MHHAHFFLHLLRARTSIPRQSLSLDDIYCKTLAPLPACQRCQSCSSKEHESLSSERGTSPEPKWECKEVTEIKNISYKRDTLCKNKEFI